MIRLITISLGVLILSGCNNSNETKAIEPKQPFVLNKNESDLLNVDSCAYQISFDSIQSISQFKKLRNNFFQSRKNSNAKFCISFNLEDADSGKIKTVIANYNPVAAKSYGGTIYPKQFLLLNIKDSGQLFSILGSVHVFNVAATKELYKYVQEFYLKNEDSTTTKTKFINIHFLYDSVNYVGRYLAQAFTGYILAQRELSLKIYKKELQYSTPQEFQALRTRMPFLFKLTYEKNLKIIRQ